MEIAVVGTPEFTLGFQLAGISHLHNPVDDEAMASVLRTLLNSKEVGIVVVDSTSLSRLPERASRATPLVRPTKKAGPRPWLLRRAARDWTRCR